MGPGLHRRKWSSGYTAAAPARAILVVEQPDEGSEATQPPNLRAHRRVAHCQPLLCKHIENERSKFQNANFYLVPITGGVTENESS